MEDGRALMCAHVTHGNTQWSMYMYNEFKVKYRAVYGSKIGPTMWLEVNK